MDFRVRQATPEDLPEMSRLWREMMDFHARCEPRFRPLPPPEGEKRWGSFLRKQIWGSEDWGVFVAEADGRRRTRHRAAGRR